MLRIMRKDYLRRPGRKRIEDIIKTYFMLLIIDRKIEIPRD